MNEIYEIKGAILEHLRRQVEQGMDRADLNELDVLVDMVKDLSEAEYHCAVTEAMEDSYGHTPQGQSMGYGQQGMGQGTGRSGYRDSRGRYARRPRMGYDGGRYGYDPGALRDMWADATPEEREQMKRDLGM